MTLILLPNIIAENTEACAFPPIVYEKVKTLTHLIAESEKEGRRYLKRFSLTLPILLLNEHTKDFHELIDPLKKGAIIGLISDAGLPCLADPGYQLVSLARKNKIEVEALIGPSSILLAIMLSGLPSQRFSFHGYLPYQLDKTFRLEKQVLHLFIEAPYRNKKTFEKLLSILPKEAFLGVAVDLMAPNQEVEVKRVSEWKSSPEIDKRPAIFLIRSES